MGSGKPDKTRFGERLKQARITNNLSQSELGILLGKDQQYIHKIEAGILKTYKEDFVLEAAKHLKCSPAWLALGVEELDRMSEESLAVGLQFEHAPLEVKNKILLILNQSLAKAPAPSDNNKSPS